MSGSRGALTEQEIPLPRGFIAAEKNAPATARWRRRPADRIPSQPAVECESDVFTSADNVRHWSVLTPLGWIGWTTTPAGVRRLQFGYRTHDELVSAAGGNIPFQRIDMRQANLTSD